LACSGLLSMKRLLKGYDHMAPDADDRISLKALYLEDSPRDAEILQNLLIDSGYDLSMDLIASENEFVSLIRSQTYDIILSDFKLPAFNAFAALRWCLDICPNVPFICVSGSIGEETASELIKQGAVDYILKDRLARLPSAIKRALDEAKEREARRRAEDELKFRNTILATQQEVSIDGILVVDEKGCILSYNSRFVNMWNIPRDVIESNSDQRTLQSVLSRIDDPTLFIEKVNYLYNQHHETSRDEILLIDGKVFDRYSAPMNSADGKYYGRVWYFRDITERRHAEEEKNKMQAQLNQAQKMESVGRLAGGVAHDFNNMLSVIIGNTEMIMNRVGSTDPLYEELEEIRNAAKRSADITRQLLAFARKQTVSPVALEVNDTVAHTIKMLQRLIGEDIDVIWKPGHNVGKILIDPSQMDQILANLAVNARDAVAGVGWLLIETGNARIDEDYGAGHPDAVPGDYVKLTMSDNGAGMSREILDHIFEPFFTTKETGKGTGLGLATVYGIVRQNNGFISVYSEPGQGSAFRIYIPRYIERGTEKAAESGHDSPRGGTETILIVEDEGTLLKLARRILEGHGYTVLSARTPAHAIRQVEAHEGEIHLLMTDVVLPEMNGRELYEKLITMRSSLKCLYMSGYTADAIAHRGVLDEGIHFLQKPFDHKAMARKVREVLDSRAH
jgi:signal transduction histidine kinase